MKKGKIKRIKNKNLFYLRKFRMEIYINLKLICLDFDNFIGVFKTFLAISIKGLIAFFIFT